jgi:hypothetical protein
MKHSKRGYCDRCTLHNKVLRTLGLRHSMLPVQVWHGVTHWRWTGGYGVLNSEWKVRIEEIGSVDG